MKDFKREIKRAFVNSGMILSIVIAVVINIIILKKHFKVSFIEKYINPWDEVDNGYYYGKYRRTHIYGGTLDYWTIFSATPYYIYIMFVLPMLAILPYGSRLFFERRSGQLKNQLIRQSRTSYAVKKYISIFFSGGISVMLPVFFSVMATYAINPYHKATPITILMRYPSWFKKLYFTHTWLFVLIVLFTWIIYGGLLASIATITSLIFDNLLTIFVTPLFIYMIISYIEREYSFKSDGYKIYAALPRQFLNPFQGNMMPSLGVMLLISLLNFGIYVFFMRRQEVY